MTITSPQYQMLHDNPRCRQPVAAGKRCTRCTGTTVTATPAAPARAKVLAPAADTLEGQLAEVTDRRLIEVYVTTTGPTEPGRRGAADRRHNATVGPAARAELASRGIDADKLDHIAQLRLDAHEARLRCDSDVGPNLIGARFDALRAAEDAYVTALAAYDD